MKTSLDCIPCLIRQALAAATLVSTDREVHEQILREVLRWTGEMDLSEPAPVMAQRIHRRLREITGREDPYRDVKDFQNRMALGLMPEMKADIEIALDPLITAARLAIAGNVIDLGANSKITVSDVRESINQALREPFVGGQAGFRKAVDEAERILYLADNAGEIAFDRLLIEQLIPARVTVAVRGAPVINDATIIDARAVGLHQIAEIIANGSDAPGTLLDDCSQEFKRCFREADLIIAKGQGNFETLNETAGNIVFLFKVKCLVVAEQVAVPIGTSVLMRSRAARYTNGGSRPAPRPDGGVS